MNTSTPLYKIVVLGEGTVGYTQVEWAKLP